MHREESGPDPSGQAGDEQSRANTQAPACVTNEDWAHWWLDFGFTPIPASPGTKRSFGPWDDWVSDPSHEKLSRHWGRYPDHDVGIIVGKSLIVFDVDTPESRAKLLEIEQLFGVVPSLIIETRKGEHHYFGLEPGACAKSDSHDSINNPSGIDIRTGRALVMIAPSTDKRILVCDAASAADLSKVDQAFVDAIAVNNGRQPPRPLKPPSQRPDPRQASATDLKEIQALLAVLDPDMGYEDWVHIGMALFYETGGSDEGLRLFDAWSGRGRKYRGRQEIEAKWRSFRPDEPNPVTIATLRHMVDAAGHDWMKLCDALGPDFEPCDYEIINREEPQESKPTVPNPLSAFSLRGRSEELAREMRETKAVFGAMGLSGQSLAIFTSPNLGKTLVSLHELINGIVDGRIDPENLYYVNVDDTFAGILTKLRIAERYGFHMLAEGLLDFSASKFVGLMVELIETDQARDVIVVLDTLKRFTNLMDKNKASTFTKIVRRFVMKGGTVIALAHTNKNLGRDGKPTYGGTSDIVDDFDCCYIGYPVSTLTSGEKVIEFENIKRRGNVVETVAYRYNPTGTQSYEELLASVQKVEDTALAPLKQDAQKLSDEAIIVAVADCIRGGVNTRKKICGAVMERTSESRRTILGVMDRYTGESLDQHHWRYKIGARGSFVYELLDDSISAKPDEDDDIPHIDI